MQYATNTMPLSSFLFLQFPLYLPPEIAREYEIMEMLVARIRSGAMQLTQTMEAAAATVFMPPYNEYPAEKDFARNFRAHIDETNWTPHTADECSSMASCEYICDGIFDKHN